MTRVACLLVALCGCASGSIYTKGPPRRIETSKRSTAPKLVAATNGVAAGVVRLEVGWQTEVTIRRRVHYGTTEIRHEHGNALVELVEVPVGLLMIAMPAMWKVEEKTPPGQRDTIVDYGRFGMLKFANPFTTMTSGTMRPRISSRELFVGEPVVRRYGMRLPAANVDVTWRALDVTGAIVAEGRVRTDAFGRAELTAIPPAAIAVEVRAERQNTVAPLAAP